MEKFILEACVDSVESAIAAAKGGADRLELCQNLLIGGTTPVPWLFQEIRRYTDIRIHVLIRPRFGDFCYTDYEFDLICDAVQAFRELGAEGIVIGILKPDGTLDMERMKILMEKKGDMSVTLHRAFDVCADPFAAMEQAIHLGIDTILTSGQEDTSILGKDLIKKLVKESAGRISIQAGSSVDAGMIHDMYEYTGAAAYHMSGKIVLNSLMEHRNKNLNMGGLGIDEYEIWRTDENKIKEARRVLDKLQQR